MEREMICRNCEHGEMQDVNENYHYRECGLDNVTIVGITIRKCNECGSVMPMIPNIEGLHDSLAQALIKKNGPLTPAEIVFLRKSLGWSGSDCAKNMHCDRSQVSKWEHGTVEMSKPYDLLLREMVASGKKITDYHSIELVWRRNSKPRPLRLQLQKKVWKEAA
jgi:putative zinc finger/helix-turn-helix YgiT family protein